MEICSETSCSEALKDGEEVLARSRKCPPTLSWLRTTVTIEVILFLYNFGGTLVHPTVQALVYRKVCLQKYNVTICDSLELGGHKHQEEDVQTDSSHWYLAEHLCFEIPSILLSSFYGSLSDNMSRKAALLLPAIGQILSTTNYVLNSVYMDLPVSYILIGPTISGIFGGWVSCGMASFAYLSDVTTAESRTWRIAIAESVLSVSGAISAFMGGRLLDSTSFQFVNSLALSVYVIMAIYIVFWIREPPSSKREGNRRCGAIWRKVCSPGKIKAAVGCVFRKRERNRRVHILVSLGVLITASVGYNRKWPLLFA